MLNFKGLMIVKCNCNHCSAHLEFDSENAGQVIACPTCGMETTLYVPPPLPVPQIEKLIQKPSSPAEALKQIRQQTCYRTLRSLIDLIQKLLFIFAGLSALASISVPILTAVREGDGLAGGIVSAILGVVCSAIIVVVAIAWKQAASLLVDIADCQIKLAGKCS